MSLITGLGLIDNSSVGFGPRIYPTNNDKMLLRRIDILRDKVPRADIRSGLSDGANIGVIAAGTECSI